MYIRPIAKALRIVSADDTPEIKETTAADKDDRPRLLFGVSSKVRSTVHTGVAAPSRSDDDSQLPPNQFVVHRCVYTSAEGLGDRPEGSCQCL